MKAMALEIHAVFYFKRQEVLVSSGAVDISSPMLPGPLGVSQMAKLLEFKS